MIRLFEINAFGYEPVPWTPVEVGVRVTGKGKRIPFVTRSRKTEQGSDRMSFQHWQDYVGSCARQAVGSAPIESGPLHIHIDFFAVTPTGKNHGDLWDATVRWNPKGGKEKQGTWVKERNQFGRVPSDPTNLFKGTEDALHGIVFADDVQNRAGSWLCLYGPLPGVRILVNRIEPGDYTGFSEPEDK